MNTTWLIMAITISTLMQGASLVPKTKEHTTKKDELNLDNGLVSLSPRLTYAFDHKTKLRNKDAKSVHDLLGVSTKWRELSEEDFIAKGLCENQKVKNLFALFLFNKGKQDSLPRIQELINDGCQAENPESCYIKALLLKRNEVFPRHEDTGLEEAKFYLTKALNHQEAEVKEEAAGELGLLQKEIDRIAAIEEEKASRRLKLAVTPKIQTSKAKSAPNSPASASPSRIAEIKKLPLNSLDNSQLMELAEYYESESRNDEALKLLLKSTDPEVIFKAESFLHLSTPKQGLEIVKKINDLTKRPVHPLDLEHLKTVLINFIANQDDSQVALYGVSVLLDTDLPDKFIYACAQTDKTFKKNSNNDQVRNYLIKYEITDSKLQIKPEYYESNKAEAKCLQSIIDLKFQKPDAMLKLAEAVDEGSISASLNMASLIMRGIVDAPMKDALGLLEKAAPTIPFANYMCAQILADRTNECCDVSRAIPYIKRALEFGCNEEVKGLLCRQYMQGLCPELEEHFTAEQISIYNKELEDSANPFVAGNACFNRIYSLLSNFKPGNFALQEKIFFKYANRGVELGNQECILALARYLVDTGDQKVSNYDRGLKLLRENYYKMLIPEVLQNAKLEEYRILAKTQKFDEAKKVLLTECKLGNPYALIFDASNRLLMPNFDDTLQQTKDSMYSAETALKEYARQYGIKNYDERLTRNYIDYRESLMLKLIAEAKAQIKARGKILETTIELAKKTIIEFKCSENVSAEFLKLLNPKDSNFVIIMEAREEAKRMSQ